MNITSRSLLLTAVLLLTASALMASGQLGIYGVVSKVVFEPNDKAPERIQIWGAFTFVDGGTGSGGNTLTPQRGYLYFALPSADGNPYQRGVALKEWADFKAIADTGQAVAFGRLSYTGIFSDELISRPAGLGPHVIIGGNPDNPVMSHPENPIRGESTAPTSPITYPVNMGLTRVSSTGDLAAIVKQLQETLKR